MCRLNSAFDTCQKKISSEFSMWMWMSPSNSFGHACLPHSPVELNDGLIYYSCTFHPSSFQTHLCSIWQHLFMLFTHEQSSQRSLQMTTSQPGKLFATVAFVSSPGSTHVVCAADVYNVKNIVFQIHWNGFQLQNTLLQIVTLIPGDAFVFSCSYMSIGYNHCCI